jgi:hypothetical protein
LPILPRAPNAYAERHCYRARRVRCCAHLLAAAELPEVYVKSHPTRFGSDVRMEIFASTWASDPVAADRRLARALSLLREALGEEPPTDA